jgi:predicted RNA methylase
VYGVDCDAEALAMAHENVVELELNDRVAFVHGVVANGFFSSVASFAMKPKPKHYHQDHRKTQRRPKGMQQPPSAATAAVTKTKDDDAELQRHRFPFRRKSLDTVVCNPPFGTKRAGIDMEFLNVAW